MILTKRRWPDRVASVAEVERGDSDDVGLWLKLKPLTVHRDAAGAPTYVQTGAWLCLVPDDRHWLAWFATENWKIDLCLPPAVSLSAVDYCDLELDVMVRRGESPQVVDRDEFEELELPQDLAKRVEDTAVDLCEVISSRSAPFGAALLERLAQLDAIADAALPKWSWIGPASQQIDAPSVLRDAVNSVAGSDALVGWSASRPIAVAARDHDGTPTLVAVDETAAGCEQLATLTVDAIEAAYPSS